MFMWSFGFPSYQNHRCCKLPNISIYTALIIGPSKMMALVVNGMVDTWPTMFCMTLEPTYAGVLLNYSSQNKRAFQKGPVL